MDHDQLVARIETLEAELDRLKAATSRRDLFKKLAVAGAGAVAGAAAVTQPAGAIDGVGLLIGAVGDANNTSSSRTRLLYAGSAFPESSGDSNFFQVRDDSASQAPPDTAGIACFVN